MKVNVRKMLSLENVPSGPTQSKQDTDLIVECAHLLEQLYPDKVILLCQKHHQAFRYAGGNTVDLWGYSKEILQSLSIDDLMAMIHPEDMDNVKRGFSKLCEIADGAHTELKSIFTYRARTLSGDYITVHDEKMRVRTSSGAYAYFNIYSKAKDQKSPVKLEIYKTVSGNRMIRVNEFVFVDKTGPFSSRELEIVKLLNMGLDNMAIAQALSLSIYTIKNHKQKMFKKANAQNSLELTRFARSLNLL